MMLKYWLSNEYWFSQVFRAERFWKLYTVH